MKNCHAFVLQLLICFSAKASGKDSTVYYTLPDSVKVVQFMAEITVKSVNTKKEVFAGVKASDITLSLESDKGKRTIMFEFPKSSKVVSYGLNTDASEEGEIEWNYNWNISETYKLLIAQATDSAGNFSLYSGYIFLPKENKWKLIGTCRIEGRWNTIQSPATFFSANKKGSMPANFGQVWCQRSNSSWKNMKDENIPSPTINLYSHVDSVRLRELEIKSITDKIVAGNTNERVLSGGIYYMMMKEGTGRQVSVNDTVTVFYKGYLFANDSVFDQTKDKPVTFPLKRLIKGWQIGLPLCKVGGKIKLIIPSDLGYSIRTRAAKIPPNSILVFEIEVVDAKSPQ